MDSNVADFKMRMFNADGSEGKMCGNASRCIGKYVYEHGLTDKQILRLETLSGIKILSLDVKAGKVEAVTVDMGEPVFNYAVAYDTHNQEPLFYEKYPGSLNDISQLQFMLDKASGCIQKNQQERRYLLNL